MIRIVCGQPVWHDALASLLREFSYECPGAAVPGDDYEGADLILTAQDGPAEGFREALQEARQVNPDLRLVCICENAGQVQNWMALEPDGMVLQQDGTSILIDAIASVLDGRIFRSSRVLQNPAC